VTEVVIGAGTDIIEIFRIEKVVKNTNFMDRFFTEIEKDYLLKKNIESTAGYFAAKEAVVKAMGTGFSGFKFTDVEIIKVNDVPRVKLYGEAREVAMKKGINSFHISISHSKEYATAVAIAEGHVVVPDNEFLY
jgi:holo-[acyl-carrier protein] synthase